ncbi:MAG: alpha/beta hydrolase [Candidatus Lokiarchaeota archaeon]
MKIKKQKIFLVATLVILGIFLISNPALACDKRHFNRGSHKPKWVKTIDSREIKLYPDLKESVWQLDRSPYASYDKIGLHRVIKEDIEPKDVVLMLPGTWSNGEQLISNPTDDPWTKDESHTFAYYLANRDFDIYALDYRTHFVNLYLEPDELSFMSNWGWDTWISDIKEAVKFIKTTSGVEKIYIAGDSFGGSAAMNYASMYWEEDLKGILLRDGGAGGKIPEIVNNSYNLPEKLEEMIDTGMWYSEVGGSPGSILAMKYADAYPGAPAQFPPGTPVYPDFNPRTGDPWVNISEWAAYMLYIAWGEGAVTNIYEGYGDPSVMIHIDATFDRYWPARLGIESNAILNWDNCPYVTYDFDDHFYEIDVPLLGFTSQLFGLNYWGPFRYGIANPDFTGIYLWGYGHLDVYSGEHSENDVSKPTYEWLSNRRMFEGYGAIKYYKNWNRGKATIFINDKNIYFRVDDVALLFDIQCQRSHPKYDYYLGTSDFSTIKIRIFKSHSLVLANGKNVHFLGHEL